MLIDLINSSSVCADIIQLDEPVFSEIARLGGKLSVRREDGYVQVTFPGRTEYLHRFAEHLAHGPLALDQEVHHRNHDPLDNRLCNLQRLSGRAHRREHRRSRSRRSSRRADPHNPLYKPQAPGPVRHLDGVTSSPPTRPAPVSAMRDQVQDVLDRLALQRDALADQIPDLHYTQVQMNLKWRAKETRKLGIKVPRLKLPIGELAFVFLVIIHHGDMAAVSRDAACDPLVASKLRKQPNIANALDTWARTKAIPIVRPPAKDSAKKRLRQEARAIQERFTALEEKFYQTVHSELAPWLESGRELPPSLDLASRTAANTILSAAARHGLTVIKLLEKTWQMLGDHAIDLGNQLLLTQLSN